MNTPGTTPAIEKVSPDVPKDITTIKFMQERQSLSFPHRIRKANEEQYFGKFTEIMKQILIRRIEFVKYVLTKKNRVCEFSTVALTLECNQCF